jgi:hypothetical protein
MKSWAKQLAGVVLVLVFALAIGGFVMVLRAQQASLASTMAAAHIRAVSPKDGATNVPLSGEIRADYLSRPAHDPAIKLEPSVGLTLDNRRWEGTAFVADYHGLRENTLYHVELDQDDSTQKGDGDVTQTGERKQNDSTQKGSEPKQIKVLWSFRTGSPHAATPTPTSIVPAPTPTISVTPLPSSAPLPTPDLIWYSGSNVPGSIAVNGIDWNGKQVKTLKWAGTLQAPNGRRIYNSMTPSTDIYDADGNRAGTIAGYSPSMWADDSRQFCGITYQTGSAARRLVTMALDGSVHTVAPIALQDMAGKPAQEVSLVACSALTGRAIVAGASNGFLWSLAMISLTDGSVIYQTKYPNPPTHLTASHDGHYVAEQVGGGGGTLIRELPSGNVVGRVTGIVVQGFSWDGALVAGGIQGNSGLTGAEVIRWQNQQVVWNRCGCPSPFQISVIAQPVGTRLAVATFDRHRVGTLIIVDADGSVLTVPVGNQQPFGPLF